jgi:putative oxidoreductase
MPSAVSILATRDVHAVRWAPAVRWLAGAIFVVFGIGKFTDHATEVASFEDYGLPSPDALVYAIGALEIACGMLLILGLATRLAALVMAGNMVTAIAVSGIGQGEVLPSLTLAPLLLGGMAMLLWTGAGRYSLDARSSSRLSTPGRGTDSGRYRP